MKWILVFSCLCLSTVAMSQVVTVGSKTSDYNVTIVNNVAGRTTNGFVRALSCNGTTCTLNPVQYGSGWSYNWKVGDTVTISASSNNGDSIINSSLLGTFTLVTVNNGNSTYTYNSTSTSSYTAYNNDYESPYVLCDQNGNLWNFYRRAVGGGSYNPSTISGRIATSYPGCSGSTTTLPTWGTPFVVFQATTNACDGSGNTDIRNYSVGKITHSGTTTFVIFWMTLGSDRTTWCGAYYAYLDNPDAAHPTTGWSSTINGPNGIPGTLIPSFMFGGNTYLPTGTFGQMFCTKTDCSEIGSFVIANTTRGCCVNGAAWILSSTDGHTWGMKNQVASTAFPLLPTNEASGALIGNDNDHFMFFDRANTGTPASCTSSHCGLTVGYTTNFTTGGQTPTWTIQKSGIPDDPRNVATVTTQVAPEMICGVSGTGFSGRCLLFYYDRYGIGPALAGSLKGLVFDPTAFTSTLNFSGVSPNNLYDETYAQALGGYQTFVLSSNDSYLATWNDFNWTVGSGSPLNSFEIIGTVTNNTSVITITGGGSFSGTVSSSAGDIFCTITFGVASGTCTGTVSNGAMVTLTAIPGSGSSFGGFSGWCGGTGSPSTCTVNANQNVTATFNMLIPNLSMGGIQVNSGTMVSQ